jgi:signal transduction histidine kinase
MTEESGHQSRGRADGVVPPALGLEPLSRIRLDSLLQELLDRVSDVTASRERLRSLLDAVVSIGTDLDLHSMLQRIVRAACGLADARYGALGVLGEAGMLVDFVTHGVDAAQRARIGDLPAGHGVLGQLIDDPRPIRLADIGAHEGAHGFPSHHPVMRTFLGVPVRIRGQVFGNLYLAEKNGDGLFTDDDEELMVALAVAAGTAIDNARLYAQTRRRQRWLEATAEITGVLLGEDVHRTVALQLVADRAREVADADLALVLLLAPATAAAAGTADTLVVEVASGRGSELLAGATLPVRGSQFAQLLAGGHTTILDDLATAGRWPTPVTTGTCLLVPLAAAGAISGALVMAYRTGPPVVDTPDVALVETFAGQAALALERAGAQQQREMLAVLSDRERIARDLHDVVVQRLFAAGTQLVSTNRMIIKPQVRERVDQVVDDLDLTIRDIRGTIFQLQSPISAELRGQIRALVTEADKTLGFRPRLVLNGPIDSAIPELVRPAVLAVLREALSNVARHARASSVTVTLTTDATTLVLLVTDDGVGIGAAEGSGGLTNMRHRAAEFGGDCRIGPADDHHGTAVVWQVPL